MSRIENGTRRLDARPIRDALADCRIGREIIVLEETTSTNDVVFDFAKRGAAEGLVVFAESQTTGRGQRGNRWISPARIGLWFSVLLRPHIQVADSTHLTSWLADRVATSIRIVTALDARVKPPNDVYLGERKVAGVLVEMRALPESAHVAIAGVGINVNQEVDDFPEEIRGRAASLAMCSGALIDRQTFAIGLLRDLDRTYAELFAKSR